MGGLSCCRICEHRCCRTYFNLVTLPNEGDVWNPQQEEEACFHSQTPAAILTLLLVLTLCSQLPVCRHAFTRSRSRSHVHFHVHVLASSPDISARTLRVFVKIKKINNNTPSPRSSILLLFCHLTSSTDVSLFHLRRVSASLSV